MNLILLFFIPAILISSIIPLTYRYKENRGMEIEKSEVMKDYIYALTMILFWVSMVIFRQGLFIYLAVFGLVAYFVYRTYTEDIMKNKYKDDPDFIKLQL